MVTRRFEDGREAPYDACDATVRPPLVQPCPACLFCNDPAQHRNCTNHGICQFSACVCDDGWSGVTCETRTTECNSGITDAKGECCESGVLDANGECCDGKNVILDAAGRCCSGRDLDACGVCGGQGQVVDALGECCVVRPRLEESRNSKKSLIRCNISCVT
jgi:hypothetical protein